DCRYAELDCVPPLPEGASLPVRGAQRVLRHVPSHHRRASPSASPLLCSCYENCSFKDMQNDIFVQSSM
uniref:Uncharacterized protein n=1 Tax=Triticum urartu TaxID=4572 RepID=A0A8R7V0M1_TRIUA